MDAEEVPDSLSEVEVLLAAREGNHEAGRALMAAYAPSMLKTAWRVLGRYGGSEAEDVVQEAFLAALTTPALPEGDVGAWMRAIAARKALDHFRSTRRRAEQQLGATEAPGTTQDETAARDDVLAVREALARLSAKDRALLVLVDLEGHSLAEAAEILGSTHVAVRLRAVRARRKLAALLRRNPAPRSSGERGTETLR